MKSIFLCALFLLVTGTANAQRLQFPDRNTTEWGPTLKNLDTLHEDAKTAAFMDINIPAVRKLFALMEHDYPNFRLVSTCLGSFRKPGDTDVIFSIINADRNKVTYLAAFDNYNKLDMQVVRENPISFEDHGVSSYLPEVNCLSWTELERRRVEFKPRKDDGRGETLHLVSKLDALCMHGDHTYMEVNCYSYDPKKKRFTEIGGWASGHD